jgi:L-fucose mutarotase
MLKGKLIHPDILGALAGAGHGSKVLISDGNFPNSTKAGSNAHVVYLNLSPGKVLVTEVLEAILTAIPVEAVEVMQPADGKDAPIFAEFLKLTGKKVPFHRLERFAFYDAAVDTDVCLLVATGDQRLYANILLTIGVVAP